MAKNINKEYVDEITKNFREAFTGKLESEKIEQFIEGMMSEEAAYPTNGSIVSMVFYIEIDITITNGKRLRGSGGGIFTPGGGALIGDIYTNDLKRLYNETTGFHIEATPVYTHIFFVNKNNDYLGQLHAGSISTVAGTGGGTGMWA